MAISRVQVEGLGKKFGLSLRNALKYGLKDSVRRLTGRGKDQTLRPGEFWALKDVSFSLMPGDSLGIMGLNGSGKTTLLRILNGTYSPDAGRATLRGRVGALIAAGAGFSPMLTGRENVFISGTLLGMTPTEIRRKFDEIVAFAELEQFIDMPVRNYSSGMSVRLGFAVAVLGSPDILLVDEVLAVGDLNFQKKCFERIQALRQEGVTILLVSHAPGSIWAVCDKGLNLHHGISQGIVPVEDACRRYEDLNIQARAASNIAATTAANIAAGAPALSATYEGTVGGTGSAVIEKLEILNDEGHPVDTLRFGQGFTLRMHVTVHEERIQHAVLRTIIDSEINKAIAVLDNYELRGEFFELVRGQYVYEMRIPNPRLRPGVYRFSSAVIQRNASIHLFYIINHAQLAITNSDDRFLYADFRANIQLDADIALRKLA
ncbi:ABC transporter ATP-binding protein [Megalodesulfovibrio gigas]|uniref:Polysaccharide ABC transporter, ATP-binding protein n=1 Tax=Megalodesulfovibrio gigas (strain ATCC 19364 / DSM 1382 / NCIMB 9332 / VKM B-1759) TaxID=1121448 RepID=T2GGA7_MEGG1|nr:ABC transporter ATP-binding protein [Megalodesulfovibrio gigas]AGW15236.1 polysaccharide ABC transporter, ATP-binding protein [Megalodesulfovibrio gigas DSM 1382 = ATCC 19364]